MKYLACLLPFLLVSTHAGDWPKWRGPAGNGISPETGLLKAWPEGGPKVVWEVQTAGVGYSSVAVTGGRIYTQGDLDGVEHAICLNEKDGSLVWAVQPGPLAGELRERVKKELAGLDRDKSGRIEEPEALGKFGFDFNKSDAVEEGSPQTIATERAARLLGAYDTDKSGALTPDELGNTWSRVFTGIDRSDENADPEALAKKRSTGYLAKLDADGDGKLSEKEYRNSALRDHARRMDQKVGDTGKGDGFLTSEEIAAYLAKSEGGKDGVLTLEELSDHCLKKYSGKDGILTLAEAEKALMLKYGGYRNGQGDGPRGTPSVDGDRVYAEGGNGDVSCLDAATGKTLWHINLSELGGGRPGWGYSESPLVAGKLLIVTPGGSKGALAALNKMTGSVVWQSADTTQGAHYSSPVRAKIGGIEQFVQFGRSSCFGVAADSGKLLWEYKKANNGTANCSDPVVHGDYVFAASAYGTGGGLARISGAGAAQKAEEIYFEKSMQNHHGGMVKLGDYLYGFGSGGLICMNYLSGEIAWKDRSVGKGSLIAADGMLYLLGEGHQMALAEATHEAYREHGRFKVEHRGRPSWAHPSIANGRLYIRNQHALTAYDIRPVQ